MDDLGPGACPPILPPPPQPAPHGTGLRPSSQPQGGLTTPSLSPISVVRNKRANQANWEKHQSRKNSAIAASEAVGGAASGAAGESGAGLLVDNCVSQGLVTPILGKVVSNSV